MLPALPASEAVAPLPHFLQREKRGGSGDEEDMERMGRAYCAHPLLSASISLLFNFLHAPSLLVSLFFFPFLNPTILIETLLKSSRHKNQSLRVDPSGLCCMTAWSPCGT